MLKFAEQCAIEKGFIKETDDYEKFKSEAFRQCFSQYKIAVGSTGNLGLKYWHNGSETRLSSDGTYVHGCEKVEKRITS